MALNYETEAGRSTSNVGADVTPDLSQASAAHHNKVGMNLVGSLAKGAHDDPSALKVLALLAGHNAATYARLVEIYHRPRTSEAACSSAAADMTRVLMESPPAPETGLRPFDPETDLDKIDDAGMASDRLKKLAKEHPSASQPGDRSSRAPSTDAASRIGRRARGNGRRCVAPLAPALHVAHHERRATRVVL
jgi:hypothetical protein